MTREEQVLQAFQNRVPTMICRERAKWLAENNPHASAHELAAIMIDEMEGAMEEATP